jgi:hypothetical protein
MGETITGCIVGEFITVVPADALKSTDPDKTFIVLVNATNGIGNESILHGKRFEKYLLTNR